jgi:hypothetical protein
MPALATSLFLDLCLFPITILPLYHLPETHVLLTGPIHLAVRVVTQISASLQFLATELTFVTRRLFVPIDFGL